MIFPSAPAKEQHGLQPRQRCGGAPWATTNKILGSQERPGLYKLIVINY